MSTLFEKALNEEIQAICPTSEIEEEIEEVSILNRVAICMGMYGWNFSYSHGIRLHDNMVVSCDNLR